MYLSQLKIWNFRKYGGNDFDLSKPHLTVPFKKGMNVLIGENDSGKTAIVDAIKYVLKTNAYESIRIQPDDFYNGENHLRIEVFIDDMSVDEAKNFTEIVTPNVDASSGKIRLVLDVTRKEGHILPYEVRGGMVDNGTSLTPLMRENLRVTYLKPLRDADNELTAKKNSRLSQILQSHELLKEEQSGVEHELITIIKDANEEIEEWFSDDTGGDTSHKKQIKDVIDGFLKQFVDDDVDSAFKLADPTMRNILERLSIGITDKRNLGLGTMNRLSMAAELLHLRRPGENLKLCLIEELEAHIHPQAQMKVITSLQKEAGIQFVLTTHSSNITSKVKLGNEDNNILMCKDSMVYPLGIGYTKLEKKDYGYLDTFLDATKSNLFFAKGVILVEGWAEEILIPTLAEAIGIDLTKHEISVINVGSTAYLHFARIFMRNGEPQMDVRCSIVTDLDVRPDDDEKEVSEQAKLESINNKLGIPPANIKLCVAKEWTLEWCLFHSAILSELFKDSVAEVHSKTNDFKKEGTPPAYKAAFKERLHTKLKNRSLDKTAIALTLSEKIKSGNLDFSAQDDYIQYLLDAIRFVVQP